MGIGELATQIEPKTSQKLPSQLVLEQSWENATTDGGHKVGYR